MQRLKTVSKHLHLFTKTKKFITSKIMFLLTLKALVTPKIALKHTNSKLKLKEIKISLQSHPLSIIVRVMFLQIIEGSAHPHSKIKLPHLTQWLYFTTVDPISNCEATKMSPSHLLWPSKSCLLFSSHLQSEAPAVSSHIAAY